MALIPKSRIPFSIDNPYRKIRPTTDKIIFLSCEGCVTEEEYFACVSKLFDEIKTKIQFVSVAEDEVHTNSKTRTSEQNKKLSKSKPKQLYEKIEAFKSEKDTIYQFAEHPDDEFWIVCDIDQNMEEQNRTDFIGTLDQCDDEGYRY